MYTSFNKDRPPPQAASSADFTGFGCRLQAERQNAVDSLERALRRCRRAFEPDNARDLSELCRATLGVPEPEPAVPCDLCTPPEVSTRPPAPQCRPGVGEVDSLRSEQDRAAREVEVAYDALRCKVERLLALEARLVEIGCWPAHEAVDARTWALARLLTKHGSLVPQAAELAWREAHERWIDPAADGRTEARDDQIRAREAGL